MITHLEPDILDCEVKWALGSITTNKASGGDRIPVELFQILKDDAMKVLHSICQQIWKTQQRPQDWKRSAFIPIPKKGNAKECSKKHTIDSCKCYVISCQAVANSSYTFQNLLESFFPIYSWLKLSMQNLKIRKPNYIYPMNKQLYKYVSQ